MRFGGPELLADRHHATHIVLLSAPRDVLVERLASRTNNPFGKTPDEPMYWLTSRCSSR